MCGAETEAEVRWLDGAATMVACLWVVAVRGEAAAVAWDMGETSWSTSAALAFVLIGLLAPTLSLWSRRGVLAWSGSPRDGDNGLIGDFRACTCRNEIVKY